MEEPNKYDEAEVPSSSNGREQTPDVEAPVEVPLTNIVTTPSHQVTPSELTFHLGEVTPIKKVTIADVEVGESEAEGDVIRSLEANSSQKSGSAHSLLMPELHEDQATDFEKADAVSNFEEEEDDDGDVLRDLTAQLLAAQGDGAKDRKGINDATKGTAADIMADKAAMFFEQSGSMPEGVYLDASGKPASDLSGKLKETHERTKDDLRKKIQATRQKFGHNKDLFVDFMGPRKRSIGHFWWLRFKFLILPATFLAAFLFYTPGIDNPPTGKAYRNESGDWVTDKRNGDASVSWWCLFIGVRLVITFASAEMWELMIVDFLACRTKILTAVLGPYVSLYITQSKGWPIRATAWGISNILFVAGSGKFANNWGYFQDWIHMWNERNPSGLIPDERVYTSINFLLIFFGVATAAKRVILSNVIGRRLVVNYGEHLEFLVKDILTVTHIALLAKKISNSTRPLQTTAEGSGTTDDESKDDVTTITSHGQQSSGQKGGNTYGASLYSTRRLEMTNLLGEWEEPQTQRDRRVKEDAVTVASLLHFRRALTFIDAAYPFSEAFGPAMTRDQCVESSQGVFDSLACGDTTIHISIFTPLCTNKDGEVNRKKMRKLGKLLKPSLEGTLTTLEFVKSIDSVYKTLRTLIASIESSSQIEKNYEKIVNLVHYFCLTIVGLAVVGIDAQAIIISFSAFFVGVGFIIGGACSKFLEGLLMIFIRKPFDVGDRIAIGLVTHDTNPEGSSGWIVENINLYSTTMRFAPTREVATVTNGELSSSRIINLQRSRKGFVYIHLKFGVNVLHTKVDLLQRQVHEFVKDRPREWITMIGFRITEIKADLGYVAYVIVLQHRESWQNVGSILTSKAELGSFALEVSKQLGMRYNAPAVPVDLAFRSDSPEEYDNTDDSKEMTAKQVMALFQSKKEK